MNDTSNELSPLGVFPEPLSSWLVLGGPVAVILFVLSVVSFAIILCKSFQLIFERFKGERTVHKALKLWVQGDHPTAVKTLQTSSAKTPVLLEKAARLLLRVDSDVELVREEVSRLATGLMHKQRSFLRILEVISMVSPLLGLMGTVIGMIKAFQQLEIGGTQVDPSALSGGIWTALLTTGIGLAVAIPSVLAYHFFEQRFTARARYLDDCLTRLFTASLYRARGS